MRVRAILLPSSAAHCTLAVALSMLCRRQNDNTENRKKSIIISICMFVDACNSFPDCRLFITSFLSIVSFVRRYRRASFTLAVCALPYYVNVVVAVVNRVGVLAQTHVGLDSCGAKKVQHMSFS